MCPYYVDFGTCNLYFALSTTISSSWCEFDARICTSDAPLRAFSVKCSLEKNLPVNRKYISHIIPVCELLVRLFVCVCMCVIVSLEMVMSYFMPHLILFFHKIYIETNIGPKSFHYCMTPMQKYTTGSLRCSTIPIHYISLLYDTNAKIHHWFSALFYDSNTLPSASHYLSCKEIFACLQS